MKDVKVEDRDRIRFPAAESGVAERLLVRHPRGVPFRFILGKARAVSALRSLDLSAYMDRAIVDDGALVECPATGDERRFREGWRPETAGAPFVRIWYVPPTEQVAESDISPDVLDRLRVLGYLQ